MKNRQQLDSSGECWKYLLFAMNFVYFAAGCAVVGVSLWVILERNFMSAILGTDLATIGAVILIVGGSLIILISFFGCCGAITNNKCMILTYFIFLVIIFLAMVVGGIICLVFRSEIGDEVRGVMQSTLQNEYGVDEDNSHNRAITRAWDKTQEFLWCCGVDESSWGLYRSSNWFKEQPGVPDGGKPYVPKSCCLLNHQDRDGHSYYDLNKCQTYNQGPPGKTSGDHNEALHYRGCYRAGKDFMYEVSAYLIGVGLGIGLSLIMGIVISILLYTHLSRLS